MRFRKFFSGAFLLWTGFAIIGAVVFWAFYGGDFKEWLHRQRFDAVAWREARDGRSEIRIRMIDDLLSRHDFRGLTRKDVVAVLGEPDETEYFRNWDMVYWLGPEREFYKHRFGMASSAI
jgi:hypothetical protein